MVFLSRIWQSVVIDILPGEVSMINSIEWHNLLILY